VIEVEAVTEEKDEGERVTDWDASGDEDAASDRLREDVREVLVEGLCEAAKV